MTLTSDREEELNARQEITQKHMGAVSNYQGQLSRKEEEIRMQRQVTVSSTDTAEIRIKRHFSWSAFVAMTM